MTVERSWLNSDAGRVMVEQSSWNSNSETVMFEQ